METSGTNAKFKVNLTVDGIGDNKTLSQVDFTVIFFTKHPDSTEMKTYTVKKSETNKCQQADSGYDCLVDANELGYGRLMANVLINYNDAFFGAIQESAVVETDIYLVKPHPEDGSESSQESVSASNAG